MTTEELLTSKGWIKGKRCKTCGGVLKYTYTNPAKAGYEIIIFPSKGTFQLKKDRVRLVTSRLVNLKHQYVLQ